MKRFVGKGLSDLLHVAEFRFGAHEAVVGHRRRLRERNQSSLSGMLWFLGVAMACLPTLCGADTPPAEKVPVVLLRAPVNLTWASNHTDYWKEKGVAGFLFGGVQDNLDADLWEKDGDPSTRGAEDALQREVRLANEHLVEEGIDRNFLTVQFAPDAAWFADPALSQKAVERFTELGKFVNLAKLRGIAIEPLARSRFYDSRWKGNARTPPPDLVAGAHSLGHRVGRAILRESSELEILLFTEEISYWSAPWVAFCEGLLQSMDAPNTTPGQASFHLLVKESFGETNLQRLKLLNERTCRALDQLLDSESGQRWHKTGGIALGLRPLGYAKSKTEQNVSQPVAYAPPQDFRTQLAMAKMLSDQYVWIEADGSSWWRLEEQDATVYGPLFQNGSLLASQTGPTVENLDAYSVLTPLDGYRRQGAYESELGPCFALVNEKGAGVFLWKGVTTEAELDEQPAPVAVTDIREGTTSSIHTTDQTAALKPSEMPIFLADLPAKRWALPATLWLEPRDFPGPETRNLRVAFGIVNRTGYSISGHVQPIVPETFAFKPSILPFDLKKGESTRVEAGLAGHFRLGEEIPIRMDLISAAGKPCSRLFSCRTVPPLEWRISLEGKAAGGAFSPAGEGMAAGLAWTTDAGELVWMSPEGTIRWRKRHDASFNSAPIIGMDSQGKPRIAAVDSKGTIRVYQESGTLAWERPPDSWPTVPEVSGANKTEPIELGRPLWADVDGIPGEELVVAVSDGRTFAVGEQGDPIWTVTTKPGEHHILSVREPDGSGSLVFAVTANGATPSVEAFGKEGKLLWSVSSEDSTICRPVLADVGGDGIREIVMVSNEGTAVIRNSLCGIQIVRKELGLRGSPNWLAATDLVSSAAGVPANLDEFLLSDGQAIYCFSNDFDPLWQTAIAAVAPPVAVPSTAATRILVPTESFTEEMCALVGLDAQGESLWWETRMPMNLSCAPLLADLDGNGSSECICGTEDRLLWALGGF